MSSSRRFANDLDNDPRARVGCDPATRFHRREEAEIEEDDGDGGSHTLRMLLFLRDNSRGRLALDCLVLLHGGDRFLPHLTRRWIARKYDVSPTTVTNMCDRIETDVAAAPIEDNAALRLLLLLRASANLHLTIDGLILAYGGNRLLPELTMRSSARRFGISVTTVSNACSRIQRQLHLPRNQNNKPEAARKSYSRWNYRPALGDAG